MFRRLICLLVSGVVFLAACGDDGTSPEDEFTEEDAQFVADLIDATADVVLNDFFDSSGGDPESAPALTHGPVIWTRTFERSRPCHDGGTLTIGGTGTSVWNAAAVTYDIESSGTSTRTSCAYTRVGVVTTLTGGGTWTHERHYTDYAPAGTWITTYVGGFAFTKSTGESGSCTYDLTRTVDTAANTRTLTGKLCGNEVNRTETWRNGSAS